MNELSKLEEVELKEFWKHEEYDFTPWLSDESNISLLGDAISMDLALVNTEENVGPYRADILCKDSANNQYVVIENQLEQTDHKHLGQIATYGAGLDAYTCIWIAKSFTEEHRAAIDWLNRISDADHNFFAIEIKLYRIGSSPLAPKFNVVAKPNNWSKNIRSSANSTPLTSTKLLQQEFWIGFAEYVSKQNKPLFRTQKPLPNHWSNIAIGNSTINIALTVDSIKKNIKIWLQIKGINAKANYDSLYNSLYDKSLIHFSQGLSWDRMDNNKMSCVELKTDADFLNRDDWNEQFKWFYLNVTEFIKLFKSEIKGLK